MAKVHKTLRLDQILIDWLKYKAKGYQQAHDERAAEEPSIRHERWTSGSVITLMAQQHDPEHLGHLKPAVYCERGSKEDREERAEDEESVDDNPHT